MDCIEASQNRVRSMLDEKKPICPSFARVEKEEILKESKPLDYSFNTALFESE